MYFISYSQNSALHFLYPLNSTIEQLEQIKLPCECIFGYHIIQDTDNVNWLKVSRPISDIYE